MNKEKIISDSYYNDIGLNSIEKLYFKLKDKGITRKDIQQFLDKQATYQQHKTVRRKIIYFPIVSPGINHTLQIDLADFSDISSMNDGFKYLIVIIDVFSRYAWVFPIKNKNSTTINNIMNDFLLKMPDVRIIMSDNGSEFINTEYKGILNKLKIKPLYVDNTNHHNHKLSIVDRFIRTLRTMIDKYLTMRDTNKYINVLNKILDTYNNSYHSSIKSMPSKPDEEYIRSSYAERQMNALIQESTFDIGDSVRFLKNRVTFSKGSLPSWSKEVHKIINRTAHSYELDNHNWFKYYELQPVFKVENVSIEEHNEPSRPQIRKENRVKITFTREGMLPENIIQGKGQVKRSIKLKDYI